MYLTLDCSSISAPCAEALKLCSLCILWYAVTAANSFTGKILISEFPHPVTLMTNEHLFVFILSFPLMLFLRRVIQRGERETPEANKTDKATEGLNQDKVKVSYLKLILPLTVLKLVQEFSGLVSVWKSTVSYSQTVKALVPFFTIAFSTMLFKERQSLPICLSLIPVMAGVGLATASEISFDYLGLLAGMTDACCFSLLSLLIKKLMLEKGMHNFESIAILSKSCFILILPIWAAIELGKFLNDDKEALTIYSTMISHENWRRILLLMGADGLLNFLQTVTASLVLACTSVLTYALANSFKRISTIGLSFLVFRNKVTPLNIVGMCMASGGVLIYSLLKAREKTRLKEKQYSFNIEHCQNRNVDIGRDDAEKSREKNTQIISIISSKSLETFSTNNIDNNVTFIQIIPRTKDVQ